MRRFGLVFALCSSLFLWGVEERIYGVMITGKDHYHHPFALCSVRSFLEQTYPNKHLLIINDGEQSFDGFDKELVTEIKLKEKKVLGALRNIALDALPENALWIQWDDDDWHHPKAIEEQYRYLVEQGADLCCMRAQIQYSFQIDSAWEVNRSIEGTILSRKKGDMFYPEIAKGEDTGYIQRFRKKYPIAKWENPPHYYIRFIHGHNTWHEDHFGLRFRAKHKWDIENTEYLREVLRNYSWEKWGPYFKTRSERRTFLLSYPRSGNTWLRFCLEAVTHRPTLSYREQDVKIFSIPLGLTYDLGTDLAKDPIWKVHSEERMQQIGFNPGQDTLILLLRDYKKCLYSDLPSWIAVLKEIEDPNSDYFQNLALFDSWDEKRRLLIYYEDLIEHRDEELKRLINFLGEDLQVIDLEQLEAESREFYDLYIRPRKFMKKLGETPPPDSMLDDRVRELHPLLWERYLSRYGVNQ